ncbi:MAG TPA: carbon-nitrogen hydrolase family protein [Phototrophicaceae bacterium]|nr:carbon-nitrogen hydrolase family protein [Phototrophicaceae bacterium]
MKLTVTELNNDPVQLAADWDKLARHVQSESSDFVLLPEMIFAPWFAVTDDVNDETWDSAVASHDRWLARLNELAPAAVLGSRPVVRDGKCLNEGFVWSIEGGYRAVHHKYYLPDEPGFWEATWYQRGDRDFSTVQVGDVCLGFAICSEVWFTEHARAYGKQGAELIVSPRCTGRAVERWLVGGRTVSYVSGAYSASANRVGTVGQVNFGGGGWLIDPDGSVLGTTSREQPFLTFEIDLERARAAKRDYPRYIPE